MRKLVDIIGLRRLETERPSIPSDMAVFAIGDLHGRLDLLLEMHQEIARLAASLPLQTRRVIVYLGDYIDHGPNSADVIDTLVAAALPGFRSIHLLGNHELDFLRFIKGKENTDFMKQWLYEKGGLETLQSYGIKTSQNADTTGISQMRVDLLRKIPMDHLEFLEKLHMSYSAGDFFFAHAGVDPQRDLLEQYPSDLLNIGSRFIESQQVLDKIIVHGHTEFTEPSVKHNRIGLDTGAYHSNTLSGLVITSNGHRVFSVKSNIQ